MCDLNNRIGIIYFFIFKFNNSKNRPNRKNWQAKWEERRNVMLIACVDLLIDRIDGNHEKPENALSLPLSRSLFYYRIRWELMNS